MLRRPSKINAAVYHCREAGSPAKDHHRMIPREALLARFSGSAPHQPLFVPDLTVWYERHQPQEPLSEVARALGAPIWLPTQLWEIETPGVQVLTDEEGDEQTVHYRTSTETLVARWTRGPDGDWWQTEYPVKAENHLDAALEIVESRRYVLAPSGLSDLRTEVGDSGIVALELPKRPYSELLHGFLGWSEGLLLLGEPAVEEMLTLLESKLQGLVELIADLPGEIVLSPDNLDAQFISPGAFERHLAGSYRRTSEVLHAHDKRLVVHVGGPIRRLLDPLAVTGVDAIQGICGPPQSDASLCEARRIVGPAVTLWGGIPQDAVLDTHTPAQFESAVAQAVAESAGDERIILGVADRVPADAEMERLQTIPALVEQQTPE
jgi:hypothetical protein